MEKKNNPAKPEALVRGLVIKRIPTLLSRFIR